MQKVYYVNVLYVKKYGKGRFQFTHPSINDYLIYRTNLNSTDGSSDGINLSNLNFRTIYGDKFKSIITFGCLLNATIQITNVNFDGEQRDAVEAEAKAKIGKWVEASSSWESLSSSSRHFENSSLIIDGTIIPRGGLIRSIDDLLSEIDKLDQLYANNDLGVLVNSYDKYSSLYPTYNFLDEEFYLNQMMKIDKQIYYWSFLAEYGGNYVASNVDELKAEYNKYLNRQTSVPFDEELWVRGFLQMCVVVGSSSFIDFLPFRDEVMSLYHSYL